MDIIAKCPRCANPQRMQADSADKRIRCPKCHLLFKVPRLDEIPKAVKAIKDAKTGVHVDKSGKTYG